jgi:hypothetical protein
MYLKKIYTQYMQKSLTTHGSNLGVSIIDLTRFESVPTRHDPKINGSSMNLIFLTRIGSVRVRVNPTRPD